MEAKTKFQKQIVGLSQKLRPITQTQKDWAIKTCTEKYAVISRKTTYCLECGHTWKEDLQLAHVLEYCNCPNCKTKLKYRTHYNPYLKESTYFGVLTTKKGFQVVRIFLVTKYYKKKENSGYSFNEVMQHWITPFGKMETLTKPVNGMSYDCDQWVYGMLEPRTDSYKQRMRVSINPWKIYPIRRVLPILKRNGFKGYFHTYSPQELFRLLLSNNTAEALFKTRQFKLIKSLEYSADRVEQYWKSIRVCIRHNYTINDASNWFDYLHLLEYFGKDILNPHYICPENFNEEHDKLALKKTKLDNEKKNREYQEQYEKEKGKFFDLAFIDNDISITPLKSIDEFIEEAHAHKHCVYASGYFKKENSLILSAKVNNKPAETIEISLSTLRIIQSRGLSNQPTQYHDKIVNLMQRNLPKIKKVVAC